MHYGLGVLAGRRGLEEMPKKGIIVVRQNEARLENSINTYLEEISLAFKVSPTSRRVFLITETGISFDDEVYFGIVDVVAEIETVLMEGLSASKEV